MDSFVSSNGVNFGSASAQVNLASPNPNLLGVYAGTENGKLSLVIVNKSPDTPFSFALSNVPTGSYFLRHFGGNAGVAKWQVCDFCGLFRKMALLTSVVSRRLLPSQTATSWLYRPTRLCSCFKSSRRWT